MSHDVLLIFYHMWFEYLMRLKSIHSGSSQSQIQFNTVIEMAETNIYFPHRRTFTVKYS